MAYIDGKKTLFSAKIDTGAGMPEGGTAGQYLKKSSDEDYAAEWSDDSFVKYEAQTLTDEQKQQARQNIGATTADYVDEQYQILSERIDNDYAALDGKINDETQIIDEVFLKTDNLDSDVEEAKSDIADIRKNFTPSSDEDENTYIYNHDHTMRMYMESGDGSSAYIQRYNEVIDGWQSGVYIDADNWIIIYDTTGNEKFRIEPNNNCLLMQSENSDIFSIYDNEMHFYDDGGNELLNVTPENGVQGKGVFVPKDVVIPDYTSYISDDIFDGYSGISSVTFGENTTVQSFISFSNLPLLTDITIPETVKYIGAYCFGQNLQRAVFKDKQDWYVSYTYNFDNFTAVPVENLEEENTAAQMLRENYCDMYWRNEKSLFTIKNNMVIETTFLGKKAESITIPDGVTVLYSYAFLNCTLLKSITIPDSVTSLGYYMFKNCTSLTSVNYTGTVSQWNKISKNSYWKSQSAITQVVCSDGTISV